MWTIDDRGRQAAAGLRAATRVDVGSSLSRLHRTRRCQAIGWVILTCVVAAVVLVVTVHAREAWSANRVSPASSPSVSPSSTGPVRKGMLGDPEALPTRDQRFALGCMFGKETL